MEPLGDFIGDLRYTDVLRISHAGEVTCTRCGDSLPFRVVDNAITGVVLWSPEGEGARITQDGEMVHQCSEVAKPE